MDDLFVMCAIGWKPFKLEQERYTIGNLYAMWTYNITVDTYLTCFYNWYTACMNVYVSMRAKKERKSEFMWIWIGTVTNSLIFKQWFCMMKLLRRYSTSVGCVCYAVVLLLYVFCFFFHWDERREYLCVRVFKVCWEKSAIPCEHDELVWWKRMS